MGKGKNPRDSRSDLSPSLHPVSAKEIMKSRRLELVSQLVEEGQQEELVQKLLQLTTSEESLLNIHHSDSTPDQIAKHCYLTIFEDILDLRWTAVPPFTSWPKNFLKHKFSPLVKEMNAFRRTPKCALAGPIIQKLGILMRECTPQTKDNIIIATKQYASKLHQQIIDTKMKLLLLPDLPPKPKKKIPATVIYKQELQPLLHIAYVSVNYLLLMIAFPELSPGGKKWKIGHMGNAMSAEQSLQSLEILSFLHFCRVQFIDSDVLIVESTENLIHLMGIENASKQIWEQMPKPSYFYENFPELAVNYKTLLCEENDDALFNRAQFYLQIFEERLDMLPFPFMTEELIPLMFYYIQQGNIFTNAISHAILRKVINLHTDSFGAKIIPKYLQISLRNFPQITRLESFVQSMILIVDILPARDPKFVSIALYCVQQQANRVLQLPVCDVSILLPTLEIIEELILTTKFESDQRTMCLNLKYVITRNFDATRKNILVNWYLNLIHTLHFNEETIIRNAKLPSDNLSSKNNSKL